MSISFTPPVPKGSHRVKPAHSHPAITARPWIARIAFKASLAPGPNLEPGLGDIA